MNFLKIFNYVAKIARPAHAKVAIAEKMEETFQEIGLDSLDSLVISMYLTEIYGVSEETCKEWTPTSIQELYDLLMANKTKEPASMEEVIEVCK